MKTILIEGVGEVILRKSARAKRLILKVNQSGQPIVTIPQYMPYILGERLALQHTAWFKEHSVENRQLVIEEGKIVGDVYTVHFKPDSIQKTRSRVTKNTIVVSFPKNLTTTNTEVQKEATKGCIRALRKLAEETLPSFLKFLADKYGYSYKEVRIKAVQTRWGSCSSNRIINLSVWLMQLPEPLTEYVLCHELTHLNNMNHSAVFWGELSKMIPDYKERRKQLKEYRPALM